MPAVGGSCKVQGWSRKRHKTHAADALTGRHGIRGLLATHTGLFGGEVGISTLVDTSERAKPPKIPKCKAEAAELGRPRVCSAAVWYFLKHQESNRLPC